jgi:hypothetical protein
VQAHPESGTKRRPSGRTAGAAAPQARRWLSVGANRAAAAEAEKRRRRRRRAGVGEGAMAVETGTEAEVWIWVAIC